MPLNFDIGYAGSPVFTNDMVSSSEPVYSTYLDADGQKYKTPTFNLGSGEVDLSGLLASSKCIEPRVENDRYGKESCPHWFTYFPVASDIEQKGCDKKCHFPCPFPYLMSGDDIRMQWNAFMAVVCKTNILSYII